MTGGNPGKFIAGDRVTISSGPLNVRADADISSALIGKQSSGSQGTILSGPTASGGFNWWKIDYDNGPDGWSAENFITKAISGGNTGLQITMTPGNSAKFSTGDHILVSAKSLNVRDVPSVSGATLGKQMIGNSGTITGGPAIANSFNWWKVSYDNGMIGWSAENYLVKITVAVPVNNVPVQNTTPSPAVTSPTTPITTLGNTDKEAPTIPSRPMTSNITSNSITFSWASSTDNIGVVGYKIFRNDIQISSATSTSYEDNNLTPSTLYTYTLSAFDAAGNISAKSGDIAIFTPAKIIPSKFAMGDRVSVTSNSLDVRLTPAGMFIGAHGNGAHGTILSGPITVEGRNWWAIDYDQGISGYSDEAYLSN